MAAIQQTSFTSPGFDYAADIAQIERRKKLAEAFGTSAMQGIQTPQTPAGGFTPRISPWQGMEKLAQALVGGVQAKKADTETRALAEKSQADYRNMVTTGLEQLKTDPAAALATFAAHPQGAPLAGLALQSIQAQRLAAALRGGQGVSTINAASGGTVPAYGSPGFSPSGSAAPAGAMNMAPGGVPMEAWLQADQSGKLLLEQMAKAKTPINVRPGGTVYIPGEGPQFTAPQAGVNTTWGPNGPTSATVPGAQEAIARGAGLTAGATEQAKFPYREVETASGRKVPAFTIPNLVQQAAAQAAAQPQQPQTPAATLSAAASPAAIPQANPKPQAASAPQAMSGGDPWKSLPKLEQPEGVGQSTYQRTRQSEAGQYGAKIAERLGPIAESANQRKSFNDQAMALVDKATTGPGAATITGIQNWLTSRFGINEALLAKAGTGDPTATLELNKNLLNAATQAARANYGSRMTQSEVMMQIKQGSPNTDMTKGAIKYLLQADNARAEYQIRQAQDFGRYLQQGGDPYQFEGWYGKNFPMSAVTTHGAGSNLVKDVINSGQKNNDPLGIRQ